MFEPKWSVGAEDRTLSPITRSAIRGEQLCGADKLRRSEIRTSRLSSNCGICPLALGSSYSTSKTQIEEATQRLCDLQSLSRSALT